MGVKQLQKPYPTLRVGVVIPVFVEYRGDRVWIRKGNLPGS
jgi:hypothetical protein